MGVDRASVDSQPLIELRAGAKLLALASVSNVTVVRGLRLSGNTPRLRTSNVTNQVWDIDSPRDGAESCFQCVESWVTAV